MPPTDPRPATPASVSDADLDGVLAVQLAVAWAGETIPGEGRIGWWRTELTDPDAGGDFLRRLLPRTHAWSALVAVREAARRVDEAARRRNGAPDTLMSLFHFGFAWDERLDGRLAALRLAGEPAAEAFGSSFAVRDRFDRAAFTAWLEGLATGSAAEVTPTGRKLKGHPASPLEAAPRLAAALLPLAGAYPLPFFVMVSP